MMKHWMVVKFFSSNRGREIPIPFYAALLWDMKLCWVLKGNGISIILAGLLSHLQSNSFPKKKSKLNPNWNNEANKNQICPKWKLISSFHFVWSRPEESLKTGSNFLRNQKSIIHILSRMLRARAPKSTTSVIIICFEVGANTQHIQSVSTRVIKPTNSQSPKKTNNSLFDLSHYNAVKDIWRFSWQGILVQKNTSFWSNSFFTTIQSSQIVRRFAGTQESFQVLHCLP